MNEHEAIVKELARRGPFLEDTNSCMTCGYDAAEHDYATPDLPADHEPDCIWRRAKALYP